MNANNDNWLLRIRGMTMVYGEPDENTDSIVACADINFDLYPGEVLGIVGESGSGKSTVVKLLYLDLEATAGKVLLKTYGEGQTNILEESSQKKRSIRNHQMGMVYQNPRDGLNFFFSSGGNIAEKLIMAGGFYHGRNCESVVLVVGTTGGPPRRHYYKPFFF